MYKTISFKISSALVLVAFTLSLVMACSSTTKSPATANENITKWNASVDELINDTKRAEKVKQLGQQFLTLEHSMAGEFTEMNKKATALNANYNSTSDEALQLFKDFEQKRIDALNKYRDLIFAVRSEVSEKEWKVLIN